jgi:diaminopimelate decarboxylase
MQKVLPPRTSFPSINFRDSRERIGIALITSTEGKLLASPPVNPKMRILQSAVVVLSVASSCSAFSGVAFPQREILLSSSSALNMANPTKSVFLTPESAKACVDLAGSPLYAYSLEKLEQYADACLAFPNAYGLTVRFAMKACPNSTILKYFSSRGIHIDASSGYECRRAMAAGIPASHISLSTQELPEDFAELVKMGVKLNAWYVMSVFA